LLTLFVFSRPENPSSGSRFAFAVGRHIGMAARRNRVKRRLREIVRLSLDRLQLGHDCLFVARNAAEAATYSELEEAALQLLARSGLIVNE
jgi:ribonuclease P protein component